MKFNLLQTKNDLLSGITVALALIPEAIAFSFVAGVDPIVGLHAAFMMGLSASILGGRPGMITGATGAIAVVLAELVHAHGSGYIFPAVFLMGFIQMIAGFFRLGKFARIIPHPVMLGFVNGLAIVIFLAQLGQFKLNGEWMTGLPMIAMVSLVGLTMAIIVLFPKLTKAVPSTLVAIALITPLAIWLNKQGILMRDVADFAGGSVEGGLPRFQWFTVPLNLETLKIILPFSLTAAAVGLIESLLTLSLVDDLTNTRGRGNRECVGQGFGNVINGLFGGMGGCAMIGQSIINIKSGGRGRLSGVVAAVSLLMFVMFASPVINVIPLAALVGVMFMVVIGTFEWETLKLIRRKIPAKDIFVILAVTVITVWHDLAIAVLVGIILSALSFAWERGKQVRAATKIDEKGSKIYQLRGSIFFGSAQNFKEVFTPEDDPDDVVIEFVLARVMDHSGIEAINAITEKYRSLGKTLHLRHLSADCRKLLKNAESVIEVNIQEDPDYRVADDALA